MTRINQPKFRGYREAVAWIAINEAFREVDPAEIAKTSTVRLLAAVSRRPAIDIAQDVSKLRREALALPCPQQTRALAFIESYIAERGQSPSLTEIMTALGCNLHRAHDVVNILAEKKMIVKTPKAHRGISMPAQ